MLILRLIWGLFGLLKTHEGPLGILNQHFFLCTFTDYIRLIKFIEFLINFCLKTRQETGKRQISLGS
jgi:hypothetical protein